MFDHIPVGVGSQGLIPTTQKDLEAVLEMGMDWSVREVSLDHCCAAHENLKKGLHHVFPGCLTALSARDTPGLRTRSTVKSTAACSTQTRARSASAPRSEA